MGVPAFKVWDPLVRLFHWSLVTAFAVAWLTAEEWDRIHEYAGYAAAGLIVFRLAWGIVGPRYARFAQFVRPPDQVLRYLGAMSRGKERRYLGHNPAGGAMIVVLLAAMTATAITGWMYTLDAFWGVEWVKQTHALLANAMLVLVAAHVVGVIVASLRHRENLALAMVLGRKRPPGPADIA